MERAPTSAENSHALREQALRCRRLAAATSDAQTATTLNAMACEYDARAKVLDSSDEAQFRER